jgi:hypothetical protein
MAISTYSELQTAIPIWLSRTQQSGFSSRVPEFIALAEEHLNAEIALRINQIFTTLSTSAASRSVSLPSDFVEPYSLQHTDLQHEYLTPCVAGDLPYTTTSGRPQQWAVDESSIIFERPCDAIYSLRFGYRKKFTLSDAAPTNWLLTNHPRAYLYAALYEAGGFIDDGSEFEAKMRARRDEAVALAKQVAARSKSIAVSQADAGLLAIGRPIQPYYPVTF